MVSQPSRQMLYIDDFNRIAYLACNMEQKLVVSSVTWFKSDTIVTAESSGNDSLRSTVAHDKPSTFAHNQHKC